MIPTAGSSSSRREIEFDAGRTPPRSSKVKHKQPYYDAALSDGACKRQQSRIRPKVVQHRRRNLESETGYAPQTQ